MRHPAYNRHGTIDLEVNHPEFGWIPFTASPIDVEAHGRELYKRALDGEFGDIAPYVAARPTVNDLSAYRYSKETAGITVNGVKVATDREAVLNLMAVRIMAREDPAYTVNWKTPDGFVQLDAATIITIADAVREHVQKCFDAEAALNPADYDTIENMKAAFDAAFV